MVYSKRTEEKIKKRRTKILKRGFNKSRMNALYAGELAARMTKAEETFGDFLAEEV